MNSTSSVCRTCPMNRRNFIARGAAAAAGTLAFLQSPWLVAADHKKTRIRIVYSLHTETQDRPDWPNKGFAFKPAMDRITNELQQQCKDLEFTVSTATGEAQAKEILTADSTAGNIDGYLVYQMNCWNRVVQTIATSGKPVLYADFQYGGSGGFLVYNAAFMREAAPNVGFVASSRMKDLVHAVRCFGTTKNDGSITFKDATAKARAGVTPKAGNLACKRDDLKCLSSSETLAQLKQSKILTVKGPEAGPASDFMGITIQPITFSELNDAWANADKDEAQAVADQWLKGARKVEGVTPAEVKNSAAMYLAEKAVMKKHGASGITINCLGGFYGGHIHAYPCLGFHQLCNDGLVGGCECDVRSAATMLIGTILTQGRPGYISDPVIDTSKRQIIYAHCVASNKMFGPKGASNPFEILSHSEDRQGAAIRSIVPTGFMTTTLKFDADKKQIIFHRAKAVENDPDDRACRTKLGAEPIGDIEKLFREWDTWGWHRVTFYGDLKEPIYALADADAWKVIEEA